MEPIRVERQTVRFFDGLQVDGYRMPNGEFRVGLASASRIMGFNRDWLTDVIDGETPRTLKELQGIGFSENIQKVTAQSNRGNWLYRILITGESRKQNQALQGLGFTQETLKIVSETIRGDREAETISLRDFNRLISYAVFDGKKAALALQLSLTEVALNDFFVDAFGEPPLSIEEKRRLFYEAYAATISPENWRQMDREDILRLALPGDEPQLQDGLWNE